MSTNSGRMDGSVHHHHVPPHLAQLRHPFPSQYRGKVFEVVLKGGRPWGFTVSGGLETQSPLVISTIEDGGKAQSSNSLQVGDVVLEVNDVQCASQTEAEQLIQSAFNTVTLTLQRGQSDFDSSSPKSIDFYKRVKDLQEKEIESQNMLSTHQPEVLGPHISEYRGGHVQMRLKKDPPQETYRPKSWHHRHEDPKQEPAVVKNQHHEHYARMKTFSPPGTSSSSFNPEHRSWKDRNYSSSSRLDIMRSTTSLVNFNEEAKPQSKRGLVKQRTNAYDDMSHRALESAKFQRSEQGEPRNTQPMFQSLNLDKQRELYRQPHVRDFEKNNRNDLSEPNREQKWKAQPHVKEQTTEPLWAKHLERNDSFSRRVERMKDNKHIPVQRVPAQPQPQPQPQQYRVEETTNIGKGSSAHQVPSSNSDVQKSQSPAWRESETSLRPNSGPAETVKRSELTFMISSDGSQPKNSEPYLKDQYLSPKPAQEYARTPPSSTRREMSPPIPPQRDSSMKSFIKYHDKSPSWPVHTHSLNKPTIETQDSPVHAHAHTWSENTYARDKANMAAEVDSQEPLFVEGHRAQVRTLPVAKQPEEKTFVYQAHKEREPEKLRSDYSEEKSRTFYHPVHISPKGGYMIDGKHYQYPPSSKFELHTATVYRVEMEEPLHAEMPEPPNSEPKFAKSYEYSEKYNIPSPPTRDIPLETQELKPELVNLDSPLPPRKRDLAKVSPERVRSPESLNSTIKSTGSTENMIQKYESFLRSNLEEQGYDSQVAEPLSTDLPKANYQRRFSREKVRDIAMKLEKDTQPCQNVVQTHLEQAPMMNGYQEETKQSPQGEHPESTLGKEKGSDDRWREDITHLDDEKASSIKRWWNSPCDYQVMPGMGTELSRKRSGMSPAEETAKRFETTLNEKGNLDDKTVSSDTNLSSDSRDELSKRLPSYSSRGDAPKPSSFTKSVEQPARHIGSRPSESGQSVTRYPESERKGISQEETYPDGVFYSQKDSHTQYSDKYRHGEPIDLLKMKEMREKERQRDREESLRKRTEAKSPVSPTNERVSILSHLQRENNQSKNRDGYAKVMELSSKFTGDGPSSKPKVKRDNYFGSFDQQDERHSDVLLHKNQPFGRDTKSPTNAEPFRRFDADSRSASMYVRSPTAEVNKFYDHVKPDEGGHSRSMSYTYDPTSPSRAHAHGHEKPLGNINEDRHNRTSESMRLSSEVKRSSESRRKSDPRRTSDPRRDPRRKDSDPNKLSESQKSFQRSVEIEGPRHHAEDISKKKVADHDRQHRTSDPYREEYSGRRSGSDLKKDRRRSDPRREHKRSDPKTEAKPDHRYSKSDSEKYHKQTASQQWHKRSDPTSRRRQPSDPEEKKKMKEALLTFYKKKTNTGQGIAPQSMHPRLEPAESTTSLASLVRQTAYGDTNSSVEGSYQGKSNVAKRSASTSSFRHTLENPEQTMLRTKSEVMRPISMPPNAYNQSDIKRQQSFSTSGVPLRDSVSSTASYRDRPSSGGSPPGSLAGSRHLSPTQSQESILGFAQRRHQRHFVAETQPSKLQGSTYMDKTASLPVSGRTGRGPPVKVSSSEAIRKMYSSQSNFKELASAAPLAKPDPSPPYRPSSSTHNRPPPLGQTDKASTLPMSFRSGEPSPGSSVQHGKLVMVEFVHSQSDSEDDRSDVEDEFDARQQQIYENPRRQSDDKIFVFPDTAPSFQTTNEPQETETQQTPKEQLTLTRQQQQSPGFPGLLKPEDQRKEKFRYRTVDSFILPTPPASPSDELVLDAEEDFPPPPPELLSNSPEIRDDSAIQRPPSREPTPSLASSTSEDNILDKVERSATMHPQTSILPGETYGSYTGKYQPRGPLAQSTATSMSSLTSQSDRTSSPINSMRPSSPRKTSPSPQPDKVVTSPSFSTAASPTVQSSVKLTLSKPPSQKSSLTSPSQFTPMKRLSPAKSLETVSQPKSPSPVKPFGMLSKFSSVQEMKRKYEFKGETLKTSPPPKSPSPTKIRSNSVGQLDSQPPQPPRKEEEEEAVTVKTVAVPKTPTEKQEETASQEANTEVKAAEESPETDKTANEEEQQQSSEDKEEENKTEDEVIEEKEEEDKRTEVKLPKEKSAEELKEEELTKAICSESKDKNLSTILAPMQRTTDDYIGVLGFPTANGVQRKRRPGANRPLNSEKPSEKKVPTQKKPDPALILPATSPYYGISAVKAQLLIENKDMQEDMEPISEDSEELNQKKEELIDSIGKKLECLREEQEKLTEETSENEELGRQVRELAKSVCKENEFNKFELFVNELDSIINLLMSLSGRLARAENALSTLDPDCDPEAKLSLEDKRDRLQNQYEEAKKLKEGIDKRNEQVCVNLRKYLCDDDYADFEHFVSMKSDLIMTSRQLNDKVKLGEEQLQALKDSMKPCNKLSW